MTIDENESSNDPFTARLSDSLKQRATEIDVHPNVDELYLRARADGDIAASNSNGDSNSRADRVSARLTGTMRTVAVVAAVLIVGVLSVRGLSGPTEGGEELAIHAAVSEALSAGGEAEEPPVDGENMIIWLVVGIAEEKADAIAAWLDENQTVTRFRYMDIADTYLEFREYFVDEPEILELVEPEQLPTSFVVTSDDPVAVATAVELLAGVEQVEIQDD